MTWTAEVVETARALWHEGYSARQVSKRLFELYNIQKPHSSIVSKLHSIGAATRAPSARLMMNVWTDESIELMRTLWRQGCSCGAISQQLLQRLGVKKSRNAVIGKLHRIGVLARAAPQSPARAKRIRRHRAAAIKRCAAGEAQPPVDAGALKPLGDKRVPEIGPNECRFICGDLRSDWAYCARPGYPYCAAHARLTYAPGAPRKRKDTARLATYLARRDYAPARSA